MLQFFALDTVRYRNFYQCEPETALCVVLYRLASPTRYKDLMYVFYKSRSWLSTVFNEVILHLVSNRTDVLFLRLPHIFAISLR